MTRDDRYDYNAGQKCWDPSMDITKTSDPSPSTPNKVEFGAKWVKLSAFLATKLLRKVGGRWDKPKAERKLVLRMQNPTELLLGRAYSHSPKFFCPPL